MEAVQERMVALQQKLEHLVVEAATMDGREVAACPVLEGVSNCTRSKAMATMESYPTLCPFSASAEILGAPPLGDAEQLVQVVTRQDLLQAALPRPFSPRSVQPLTVSQAAGAGIPRPPSPQPASLPRPPSPPPASLPRPVSPPTASVPRPPSPSPVHITSSSSTLVLKQSSPVPTDSDRLIRSMSPPCVRPAPQALQCTAGVSSSLKASGPASTRGSHPSPLASTLDISSRTLPCGSSTSRAPSPPPHEASVPRRSTSPQACSDYRPTAKPRMRPARVSPPHVRGPPVLAHSASVPMPSSPNAFVQRTSLSPPPLLRTGRASVPVGRFSS